MRIFVNEHICIPVTVKATDHSGFSLTGCVCVPKDAIWTVADWESANPSCWTHTALCHNSLDALHFKQIHLNPFIGVCKLRDPTLLNLNHRVRDLDNILPVDLRSGLLLWHANHSHIHKYCRLTSWLCPIYWKKLCSITAGTLRHGYTQSRKFIYMPWKATQDIYLSYMVLIMMTTHHWICFGRPHDFFEKTKLPVEHRSHWHLFRPSEVHGQHRNRHLHQMASLFEHASLRKNQSSFIYSNQHTNIVWRGTDDAELQYR